jgi:DNA-binding NarL/FixJ family response regulator
MTNEASWVLLVEDDRLVARGLGRIVERNARVAVAPSLAAAYQRFQGEEGGLRALIVDVLLPDGSGFALAEHVRTQHPTLPVLVITGGMQAEVSHRAFELRAELLIKPFSSELFTRFVVRALSCAPCAEGHDVATHIEAFCSTHALSARERQVLELAMRGESRRAMGDTLGLTQASIKTVIARLLHKCAAPSLVALTSRVWMGASA